MTIKTRYRQLKKIEQNFENPLAIQEKIRIIKIRQMNRCSDLQGGFDMTAGLLTIFLMGGTFIYMMWKAEYAQTRRWLWCPWACARWKCCCSACIRAGGSLTVTLLLWAAKAVILACCAGAMRQDAARAQRRQRRRAVRRTVEAVQAASETSRREPCALRLVPPSSRCA